MRSRILSLRSRSVAVGAGRGALAVVLIHGEPAGPLVAGCCAVLVRRLALNLRARSGVLRERRRGNEGNESERGQDGLHVWSPGWLQVTAAICSAHTARATNNGLSKTLVRRTRFCAALCEAPHTLSGDDLCEAEHNCRKHWLGVAEPAGAMLPAPLSTADQRVLSMGFADESRQWLRRIVGGYPAAVGLGRDGSRRGARHRQADAERRALAGTGALDRDPAAVQIDDA